MRLSRAFHRSLSATGVYVAGEPVKKFDNSRRGNATFDPYVAAAQKGASSISESDFLMKSKSDHPAVLGACGSATRHGALRP